MTKLMSVTMRKLLPDAVSKIKGSMPGAMKTETKMTWGLPSIVRKEEQ
jgi:hypothetical protein